MNKIYVGNLPFDATEATIEELFAQFGEISEVALIRDRDSKRSRGFGFVTFASADAAQNALSLNNLFYLNMKSHYP